VREVLKALPLNGSGIQITREEINEFHQEAQKKKRELEKLKEKKKAMKNLH